MARRYTNPVKERRYAPKHGKSYKEMSVRNKAEWLRDGGGSWSDGELMAMVAGRSSEAYDYTFRLGDGPVPPAIREAAKIRLKERFARDGRSKDEVRMYLRGYGFSPQMIGAFLKGYRRAPGTANRR
jgi:hypothetical protein